MRGLDTHELNRNAFELPTRRVAKFYLFRTIYRGTGWGFAHDPDFTHVSTDPKFWDDINEKFYRKYTGLDTVHKRWADQVVRGNRITTMFGRGWTFEMGVDKRGNPKLPWSVFTNYPVQGTAADIMTIARVSFARRLKSKGWPVLLISTVHDSIVVDCDNEYVLPVLELFHSVFDDLIGNIKKLFKYEWVCPLACEGKVGYNMNDMYEVTRDGIVVLGDNKLTFKEFTDGKTNK